MLSSHDVDHGVDHAMRESAATSAETTTAKLEKPAAPEPTAAVAAAVVAIKVFNKKKMNFEALQNAYKEIELLDQLDHPHIIRKFGCYEGKEHICLITELMSIDLHQLMI